MEIDRFEPFSVNQAQLEIDESHNFLIAIIGCRIN